MVGVVPEGDRAFVVAQDVDVIEDVEAYAVYRAVLPINFKDLTHITLLQETRAGRIDCPRDETIQPEWRPVVENYRTANARIRRIQAERDLGVPYALLTWAELTTMMQDAGYHLSKFSGRQSPGAEVFPFKGWQAGGAVCCWIQRVEDPSHGHSAVQLLPVDGAGVDTELCHQGNQVMVEKQADRWVPSKVGGCGWIA